MNHSNARKDLTTGITDSTPDSATSATATRIVNDSHHGDTTWYDAYNTIGNNDTKGGQGQHSGQQRPREPSPGVARSHPERQNTTIHQGITYNALAISITSGANAQSSAGGALANTVTSTTHSGNTATPPPTHSIDTLDHNRCHTYHYRFKDSQRNYPNTRDNRQRQNHKPTNHQPRVASPEPPTTQAQAAPSTNTNNTTSAPTDHHETSKPPSITYDTLTIGNTSAFNTDGTIHTTANPTNDVPESRHLQHSYHRHHDPGTE